MCKDIWIKANLVSFLGLIFTALGIYFCFIGKIGYAVLLLAMSGISDGIDGNFAKKFRKKGQNPEYGVQLDSLADIVCSGVLPVIICLSLGFTEWYNAIIYCIFLICGITRLTYYNVNSSNDKFYKGVPITVSTFVIPIIYCFTKKNIYYSLSLLILSICYVLNIKIEKPGIRLRIILSALILTFLLLFFIFK